MYHCVQTARIHRQLCRTSTFQKSLNLYFCFLNASKTHKGGSIRRRVSTHCSDLFRYVSLHFVDRFWWCRWRRHRWKRILGNRLKKNIILLMVEFQQLQCYVAIFWNQLTMYQSKYNLLLVSVIIITIINNIVTKSKVKMMVIYCDTIRMTWMPAQAE